MPKAQSKKRKKGQRTPNIPMSSALRPRLDARWGDDTFPQQPDEHIVAELDSLTQGIKPFQLLPILLTAYHAAPSPAQERLNDVLPGWLEQHDYLATLEQLIAREQLDVEQQRHALAWLKTAGTDTEELLEQTQQSTFYKAMYAGNQFQATLIIFWFTDRRRNRVQGINFLIDYVEPWNGSVKDGALFPRRPPEQAVEDFTSYWEQGMGASLTELPPEEARRMVVQAMQANRAHGIRLHGDLLPCRNDMVRHILTLPGDDADLAFSTEDLDYILMHGMASEMLQQREEMGMQIAAAALDNEDDIEIVMPEPEDDEELDISDYDYSQEDDDDDEYAYDDDEYDDEYDDDDDDDDDEEYDDDDDDSRKRA